MSPMHRALGVLACALVSCEPSSSTHVGNPIFVSAGSSCNQGTSRCPYGSIARALEHPAEGMLEIVVRSGDYREHLVVTRDVFIRGARGGDHRRGDRRPRITAPGDVGANYGVRFTGDIDVRLAHLRFEGDPADPGYGLVADGGARVEGEGIDVSGFAAVGVSVQDARVSLAGSRVAGNGGGLATHDDALLELTDVSVTGNRGRGITVKGGQLRVQGGVIAGTEATREPGLGYGDGILTLDGASAVVEIRGAVIEGNARAGVLAADAGGVITLDGNRIVDNGGPGVWLQGPLGTADGEPASAVTGNVVESNRLAGIGVTGQFAARLDGNQVSATATYAVADGRPGGDGIAVLSGGRVFGEANESLDNARAGFLGSGASGRLIDALSTGNDYGRVSQLPPAEDPLEVVGTFRDNRLDNEVDTAGRLLDTNATP